jgi:Fur family transcriptional regulator, ferric uptake regulator
MSCEQEFFKQLHQRGFRLTPQRELVLKVLHQVDRPASVDELYACVAGTDPRVELSTVYRTLDLLTGMNLVTVIDSGDKQRRFELVERSAPHLHLVCRECGKITGIELAQLSALAEQIRAVAHFHTDFSNLTISGVCEKCAQPQNI